MSKIIFLASILAALFAYVVVFMKFDKIIGEFAPMFWLCVITFVMALGIVVSAFMRERASKKDF